MANKKNKTSEAQKKAVREYEKRNCRINTIYPSGTKERIEALGLDITVSTFIKNAVLNEIERLEKESK